MPKLITFQTPAADGSLRPAEGYVVWLQVGSRRHKFVLQLAGARPSLLTDYRSGYVVRDLAPKALAAYVSHPYGYDDTLRGWRHRAQESVAEIVAMRGEDAVLRILNTPATVNA